MCVYMHWYLYAFTYIFQHNFVFVSRFSCFFVNWADETLIHGDEKHVVYVQSHRPFVVHSYITTLWSQEAQEWPHERADPLSWFLLLLKHNCWWQFISVNTVLAYHVTWNQEGRGGAEPSECCWHPHSWNSCSKLGSWLFCTQQVPFSKLRCLVADLIFGEEMYRIFGDLLWEWINQSVKMIREGWEGGKRWPKSHYNYPKRKITLRRNLQQTRRCIWAKKLTS